MGERKEEKGKIEKEIKQIVDNIKQDIRNEK